MIAAAEVGVEKLSPVSRLCRNVRNSQCCQSVTGGQRASPAPPRHPAKSITHTVVTLVKSWPKSESTGRICTSLGINDSRRAAVLRVCAGEGPDNTLSSHFVAWELLIQRRQLSDRLHH